MKSTILLSISLLIASVSAACNCKPSEQACIDTCVKTANACVTQCNTHNPSKECINGCIAATWPTSITLPDQKVMLDIKNTTSVATLSHAPSQSIVASKSTGSILPTTSPKTNLETNGSLTQTYSLSLLLLSIGSFALF